MADNSAATVLLCCVRCGQKYQAVTPTIRWCLCGGALKPVEKREEPK